MVPHLLPEDEHNRALERITHPSDWVNPTPRPRYHLVVVGAGTAGLVSAAGAAGLGAKVALVERGLMGGDCLNFGCVPSKALLRCARAAADVRDAAGFGIHTNGAARVDFADVMERMRRLRAAIAPHDSAERFRSLGIDVFLGQARFVSPSTLTVGKHSLNFRRAIIATGGRPAHPEIVGLEDAGYLTNETVFSLTELPKRLAVVGAGPIGCELAQAFARFGSKVSLIANHERIMPRDEPQAVRMVEEALRRDGVEIHFATELLRVTHDNNGRHLHLRQREQDKQLSVDAILVGVGRSPNVEGLGFEDAGIAFDTKEGVHVNDRLRTSNSRVYAAGDICSRYKFTHAADAMARIAVQNALFPFPKAKASALTIPHCTYTDPEIAQVGLTPAEAERRGSAMDTFTQRFDDVDRAVLDGETEGFVQIHVKRGTDRIVGGTIVARHAGDMIALITTAMVHKIDLRGLAKVIFPYPTQSEAVKRIADAYNRTRLTPSAKWLLQKWFAWT
ncbi:MAG: mercuric reductase [Gemmataceae bacterium]|nr:mercuric reductase [Gemmataceae bacterium]MCI0741100.1 mercuric reductase [Gemmataceae bacterium]